jgi:hypothetical protein
MAYDPQKLAQEMVTAWLSSPNGPSLQSVDYKGASMGELIGAVYKGVVKAVVDSAAIVETKK